MDVSKLQQPTKIVANSNPRIGTEEGIFDRSDSLTFHSRRAVFGLADTSSSRNSLAINSFAKEQNHTQPHKEITKMTVPILFSDKYPEQKIRLEEQARINFRRSPEQATNRNSQASYRVENTIFSSIANKKPAEVITISGENRSKSRTNQTVSRTTIGSTQPLQIYANGTRPSSVFPQTANSRQNSIENKVILPGSRLQGGIQANVTIKQLQISPQESYFSSKNPR